MENKLSRFIYNNSSPFLQDVFTSIFGWKKQRMRLSFGYRKWAKFFKESHLWTNRQLVEFQEEKLRTIIQHCYDHVPYYQELFGKLKLTPEDITCLDDLKKIPILDKEQVRSAGTSLIAGNWNKKTLLSFPTSGSTGTPLKLYWSKYIANMEHAFVYTRYRNGVSHKDPRSSFTGLEIVDPRRKKPPFWRNNWASHQRMYSIFHMSEDTLPYYFEALNSRYSKYYSGYASMIYVIADYIERTGKKLKRPPEAIFPGSEELQPVHEETIERVFGCKVWNRYGLGELVGSITKYHCGHLHYDMDYSILEFLPIGQEDGLIKAEVIGTHLHHYAWPLLRYRTGDIVLYDPSDKCEHNIPGQIIRRAYGRTGHHFVLPNGNRVYNISVIAKKCKNIRFMQVVQEKPGEIIAKIIKYPEYTKEDELETLRQFRLKIGNEIKIKIEYVDKIERTAAGKFLSIINRIKKD